MKPESSIYLCNIPELPSDSTHTWLFENLQQQQKFFNDNTTLKFEKYSYLRKSNSIKINVHIDSIHAMNYVCYKNKFNKWYYCFIIDKQYVNELTTEIFIKTDLLQTYMFDYELDWSYVDRCHVDRWDRNRGMIEHIEPEDLEFGELEETYRRELRHWQDGYLIIASNPLGSIPDRTRPAGGGTPQPPISCGDWKKGIISPECLRFIKGEEGYAPNKYLDTIAKPPVWTIGYGVTLDSEPDAFNYLDNMRPASEQDCAKVSYYLKNERYGKAIIQDCINAGITEQHEFDAILSFVYNLGTGSFKPGKWVYDAVVQYKKHGGSCQLVKDALNKYTSGGVPGLIERRKEEGKMFCGEKYRIKDIDTVIGVGQYGPPFKGDGWLPKCTGPTPSCKTDFNAYGLDWTYPTHGKVEAVWDHYPSGPWHPAVDISCPIGTPVYATRDLYIEEAGELKNPDGSYRSYGIYIKAKVIGEDYKIWYAHLSKHRCKTGDTVKCGTIIADSGNTGKSTGPHLHYEMRVPPYNYGSEGNTNCIDPMPGVPLYSKI